MRDSNSTVLNVELVPSCPLPTGTYLILERNLCHIVFEIPSKYQHYLQGLSQDREFGRFKFEIWLTWR